MLNILGATVLELLTKLLSVQESQQVVVAELREMSIEQLEYIKRIQNEGTIRMTLMEENKAKDTLAKLQVMLPISSMGDFRAVESLLKSDAVFKEALVNSTLYIYFLS